MILLRQRRVIARLRDESGIALVLAIAVMLVLTIGTISITAYSMSNESTARRYTKVQVAFNLAESGIANGVGMLANPANTTQLLTSSLIPTAGILYTYGTGTVRLWGSLDCWTPAGPISCTDPSLEKGTWHLTATSFVPWKHSGTTSTVSRTVHVDVPIGWSPQQPRSSDAWEYIYSKNTSGTAVNLANCDETLFQNVTVTASMYVNGNLCMNTPSSVEGTTGSDPPVSLIVKGWVEFDSNTDLGKTHALNTAAEIDGGGCSNAFAALVGPTCGKTLNNFQVYPNSVLGSTTIAPPSAHFDDWYKWASPGPLSACTTSSPTPPVFDNNTTNDMNLTSQGSLPTVIDLAPTTTDYSCSTSEGSISWKRGSPGKLTLTGTIYIDGSATASSSPIDFDGQGTIYVSGTFLLRNTALCAILNGAKNGCDSSAWLSASSPDILMIAANGRGTGGSSPYDQVAAGDSVEIKSSSFQGGLYGSQTIEIDTTSDSQGPMVAGKEIISQHGGSPFPHFALVPSGTPDNKIVNFVSETPQYWSGG